MRNNLFMGVATVALIAPAMAGAQETTSTIRGSVTSNGAAVAGATVEIVNVPSGTRSTTSTDDKGNFTATGLRPGGPYTVSVTSQTGATQVTDIFTSVATPYDLPIELAEAGGPDIVVTASSIARAGSVSQGPATVLTAEKIATIASINRDIRDLSRRDPFARLDDTPSGGRAVSFAGQNARYNRFSVDGVPVSDNFGLNPDGLPSRRSPIPLDAIGQFQAKVAPYDVREGNFQGGAINIILKSGTNEFHGTGFYSQTNEDLTGKKTKAGPGVPTGRVFVPNFKNENYGAELSGPIIKDKLFFMIAGERLRSNAPIPEGPNDNNSGTAIPNLTQALVDRISGIAQSAYGYDTGGVLRSSDDKDDRLVAKIDANLSDTQRLALTYSYAKDQINLVQNTNSSNSTPGLGLASDGYIQGNRLHTGVVQLNSDWSDEFSTEVRGFYKNYKRQQDPILGRGFAQITVCTAQSSDRTTVGAASSASINCPASVPTITFGPDVSRQINTFDSVSYGGTFQARLTRNDHDLKVFADIQHVANNNEFLAANGAGVAGAYYFDSIDDFVAKNAQRFRYNNAVPSLDPTDAASNYTYMQYTFGIQDSWRLGDTLNVSYGARYDMYGGHNRAALNPTFLSRYGYPNNSFISGRGVFQPRFGFDWKPFDRVSIRGGAGIFSGGSPDVYISNSFSNTGIISNAIDIQQINNGTYTGATQAQGAGTLTNVNGAVIPAAANEALLGTGGAPLNSPTNALDPNFQLPSQWRYTLSVDYDVNELPLLGTGWGFGADIFYSDTRKQVYFTDLRVRPNGLRTPDGRTRYTPVSSFTDTGNDILLTNDDRGYALVAVARARKTFAFGLDAGASFTFQDIKDANPATSSTASSNYAAGVSFDGIGPAYGISNDQVKYNIKYDLTFQPKFFGDYKTTFALFGETRIGRPYSYTMRDTAARSVLFGTTGSGTRYLLYVPTGIDDPLVSYDNANNATLFNQFIEDSGLAKYRGKVAPRNVFNSKWFTRFDLHLAQEIPTFVGKSRIELFADIENVTNLINKNWGQIREYGFPYTVAPVIAQCLTRSVATGTATTGATSANAGAACTQYRYSPNQTAVVNGVTQFTAPTDTIYPRQSLYSIRLGARFRF